MATKLLDQQPQYRDDTGAILAAGTLNFFDSGTSTVRSVFGEKAATTNLGAVLTLNSAGRTSVNPWLVGGPYRVTLKNSAGTQIWSKDEIYDLQSAVAYTVPNPASGTNGQVVQTNGTAYSLATIVQVPDPTGHAAQQLGTDGALVFWEAKQTIPVYTSTVLPGGIVQTATTVQIGKFLIQTGSCTAPNVAGLQTSITVTFPTAYVTLLHVGLTPSVAGIVDGGGESGVTASAISRSAAGFTASFYLGLDHASDHRIASAVTATWVAYGIVA